ncbi:hypothetical protein CEW92_16550 [Bacillaceae bacterium SAS-127]|nr:hypothetical protein CEW92_16550 [Bacillaceae bacterium SAS-127]
MEGTLIELFESCLSRYQFRQLNMKHCEGCTYMVKEKWGEGIYWYYSYKGLFAVTVHNLQLKEDFIMEQIQSESFCIYYYESIDGVNLIKNEAIRPNKLYYSVSDNDLCRVFIRKHSHLQCVSLEITPSYYEQFLKGRYACTYEETINIIKEMAYMRGCQDLIVLLMSLKYYQGSGSAARIFYESKVAEALSIILSKQDSSVGSPLMSPCLNADSDMLQHVIDYIDQHFEQSIRLHTLAKISCMGTTSLKTKFKSTYGCTITEYIQKKRIQQAQQLLMNSDLLIGQISATVGYNTPSYFTEIFRKQTGVLPKEYRELYRQ